MELIIKLADGKWVVVWRANNMVDSEIECNDFGQVLGELIEFRDSVKNTLYPHSHL